jgi:hypothetical protein
MAVSNFGALKTLYNTLVAAPQLAGVSVVFGEENIRAQEFPLPMVVLVPTSGTYEFDAYGYAKGLDPDVDMIWPLRENLELHLWAFSDDPAATPIDHANEVEGLRQKVLRAMWAQRAEGTAFDPASERWALMQDQVNRYGRVLIMTVRVDVYSSITDPLPVEATVTSVPVTVSIES